MERKKCETHALKIHIPTCLEEIQQECVKSRFQKIKEGINIFIFFDEWYEQDFIFIFRNYLPILKPRVEFSRKSISSLGLTMYWCILYIFTIGLIPYSWFHPHCRRRDFGMFQKKRWWISLLLDLPFVLIKPWRIPSWQAEQQHNNLNAENK